MYTVIVIEGEGEGGEGGGWEREWGETRGLVKNVWRPVVVSALIQETKEEQLQKKKRVRLEEEDPEA